MEVWCQAGPRGGGLQEIPIVKAWGPQGGGGLAEQQAAPSPLLPAKHILGSS